MAKRDEVRSVEWLASKLLWRECVSGLTSMTISRTVDRWVGFCLLFASFSLAIAIAWCAMDRVKPQVPREPAPAAATGLPGFPRNVDPLSALPLARRLTPRVHLRRIFVTGVDVNGTVDVTSRLGGARFEFFSEKGAGPQPERPQSTTRSGAFCGRQTVHLAAKGLFAAPDRTRAACRPNQASGLPEPQCAPSDLWKQAVTRGAKPEGRAVIEYFQSRSGPAWKFSLPTSDVRFVLAADCQTELRGTDSVKR